MTSIFVVEDEPGNLHRVKQVIATHFPDVAMRCATDLASAKALFDASVPDLAILDIEYPDGNAFDLLRSLPDHHFRIIFISGYEKYALQAIRFAAIDYLLKPFAEADLAEAIRRALAVPLHNRPSKEIIHALLNNYPAPVASERQIVLKTFEEIHILKTSDILHCQADNNYTTFYLGSGEKVLVSKPIGEYEELLGAFRFMRVHQSHLVNLMHIRKFDKRDGGTIVMCNQTQIPVSTRKKPQLMEYIASLE